MNCLFNAPGAVHEKKKQTKEITLPHAVVELGKNTQSALFNFFESSETKCLACQRDRTPQDSAGHVWQ